MNVKIQYAIPCDDARREDNGKLILIGVYGQDIGVTRLPATLVLTLVVNILAEAGEADLQVEGYAGKELKAAAKGHLAVHKRGPGLFIIPGLVFAELKEPTELSFRWKIGSGDWQSITSIPFVGVRS